MDTLTIESPGRSVSFIPVPNGMMLTIKRHCGAPSHETGPTTALLPWGELDKLKQTIDQLLEQQQTKTI